jgi:DNA-binding NtrC family response regulator
MKRVLLTWVGSVDIKASRAGGDDLGPIASTLRVLPFQEAVLLSSHPAAENRAYAAWLRRHVEAQVTIREEPLTGPTRYSEIHQAAVRAVRAVLERLGSAAQLTFHLSPGTPAMAAVWILLSKTVFPAELIESSRAHGVATVEVPFSISAEFLPDLLQRRDEELARRAVEAPPEAPEFEAILHRGASMRRLIARARRVALRSVPALIEGESGTGKELVARAIHRASPRAGRPFIAVNCGAIPAGLTESELFGHERGAFTDARTARLGHFREAAGGTLFLDEVAELPLHAQVKLLRTLQAGEVVPVGASAPIAVDVRIIAATHRNLLAEVSAGRFRSDLFYRLAVAVLVVPPLRERSGDVSLLVDHALEQVNAEGAADPGYVARRLTPAARNVLLSHAWPGNVRELFNTLRRAAIWSLEPSIDAETVREALLGDPRAAPSVLDRPLGDGVALPEIMADVARHYLERALKEAEGNKTRAAALLGLGSHQSLTNWMERYGVAEKRPRRRA